MEFSCIDLLPQASTAIVRDSHMREQTLKLMHSLTKFTIHALEKFHLHKQYEDFDPHVGETACQIRAYILLLTSKTTDLDLFHKKRQLISTINKNLEHALTNLKNTHLPNNQLTIETFLKQNEFYYELNDEEILITTSYFLTEFKEKEPDGSTYINHDKIADHINSPRKLAKKLTRQFQLILAQLSCQKIFQWGQEITYPNEQLNILKKLQLFDDDARSVLPCYYFTKILFHHLLKKALPIIVIITHKNNVSSNQICLLSYPNLLKSIVPLKNVYKYFYNESSFIIEGETLYNIHEKEKEYLAKINQIGIETILLANMAIHPQYSGNKLSEYCTDPFGMIEEHEEHDEFIKLMRTELSNMSKAAKEIGCCKENPALFLVNHIYCDTIKNIIKKKLAGNEVTLSNYQDATLPDFAEQYA